MDFFGNLISGVGTALNLPEYGFSESLNGNPNPTNTTDAYSSGSTGLSGQNSDGTFGAYEPQVTFGSPLTLAKGATTDDPSAPNNPYAPGGSTAPSYSAEDLAYLDSQGASLDRQLGRTDTTLRDTLDAILQNYNKELSGANTARGRNLEDFNTKTQVSEQGRGRELDKVSTNNRMLADQLRQKIGLSSGSGSSAYQLAAPRAVQRKASGERGDVLTDYSQNFQALDTDKRRGEEDFSSLLQDLERQRSQREGGARGEIETARNDIFSNQGRVAGERAKLLGGGYTGVKSAMQPYEDKIAGGESLIDSIYSKYAAKYDAKPLQVNNTQLKDYAVDKTAVRDNAANGTEDPYAPFKPFNQDEEENLGF